MSKSGTFLIQSAVAALIGAGAMALSASTASAHIVCNDEGDCWHSDQRYRPHADVHLTWHPDNWYFHNDWDHDHDHHWRGHREGRGYWKGGIWIQL